MTAAAWMTTAEAAAYAGMSAEVLARLARQKKIQRGSDGRKWKFKAEFIDAYYIANGRDR